MRHSEWSLAVSALSLHPEHDLQKLHHGPIVVLLGSSSMESNRWLGGGIGNPSAQCETRALLVVHRGNWMTNRLISQMLG
jgi:hypothetical protein